MKQEFERIWLDKVCRMPLNRVRWTAHYCAGSTQETPDLYYSAGDRLDPKGRASPWQPITDLKI